MDDRHIPDVVQRFVLTNLHSVEQLEVLLHLRKNPDREWSAESVSDALRTTPTSVASRLKDLHSRGLISRRQAGQVAVYRYLPPAGIKSAIDSLAQLYGTHRVRIIALLYPRPAEAIRWFSDAFRLRKDDEE